MLIVNFDNCFICLLFIEDLVKKRFKIETIRYRADLLVLPIITILVAFYILRIFGMYITIIYTYLFQKMILKLHIFFIYIIPIQ